MTPASRMVNSAARPSRGRRRGRPSSCRCRASGGGGGGGAERCEGEQCGSGRGGRREREGHLGLREEGVERTRAFRLC
eukprot:3387412-Rhodomonas_salina.1